MEIKNAILKGMVQDVDPRLQPDGTWRDSRNGTITQYGNTYVWRPILGTWQALVLSVGEVLMNYCNIRDRYFCITFNQTQQVVNIWELFTAVDSVLTSGEEGTKVNKSLKWWGDNTELGLDINHPIRSMFGIYENEDVQRIYWSDFYNQPRVLNIGNTTGQITLEEKFVNYVPIVENGYGTFEMNSIVSGGTLRAGSYFFVWQFYTGDGYFTDWSYMTNPTPLTGGNPTDSSYDGYQAIQGMAPDENTTKTIRVKLTDLDADYPSIRIAAFYSNDDNSIEPGIIFYDGSLGATEITVDYRGNENLGTVTIEEVIETSITIVRAKDVTTIKNISALINIEERPELDVSGMNTENKNDRFEVTVDIAYKEVNLDIMGAQVTASPTAHAGYSPQHLLKVSVPVVSSIDIIAGFWYIAKGTISLVWEGSDTSTVYTIPVGSKFYAPEPGNQTSSWPSSYAYAMIRIKKYRLQGAVAPYNTGDYIAQTDDLDDYVWDEREMIEAQPMDWKNPHIANKLRGYPGGEVVRLAVIFYDLAGRPYFARWLKNTDITYGQGDITTPKRNDITNRMTIGYDDTVDADETYYQQINARTMGIKISDLDITDIRDKISGFMIVRAPLIRQYLAQGILVATYAISNDTYQYAGFVNENGDVNTRAQTYAFFCPEHLFGAKGFQIQESDQLENIDVLWPFHEAHTAQTNWQGFGKQDGIAYSFWQKFLLGGIIPSNSNAQAGSSHEILHHIPFNLEDFPAETDNFDEYDPRFPQLTYNGRTRSNGLAAARYGKLSDHSIVILDIDESSNNLKIPFNLATNDPRLTVCAIKRANANPYGGTGESSLANTIYQGVGHYQIIDATVLANIESGGRYVFNEIEIFGGDTYVQLFDIQRCYMYNEESDAFAHSITFPVESRMLIGYREGDHHGRERYYDATVNPSGLRYNSPSNLKVEEFNYNDGYSTDHAGDFFLPLPFNFTLQSQFSTRFRYTNTKSYSELQDSYRVFPATNLLDLDTSFGKANNIRAKFGRIAYWQDDAVGYIPIHERQLSNTEVGNPVQIGVGGVFERFDEVIENIGNQHQFGLVESDNGFHWIDSRRKVHVTMTNSFKISEESITKGLDSWFQQNIPDGLDEYDNPALDHGIIGGYDRKNRVVLHRLDMPGGIEETIGFNIKLNAFEGFFDYPAYIYLLLDNHTYGMAKTNQRLGFVHTHETPFNQIYGVEVDSYLELIANDQSQDPKIFDTMVLSAGRWIGREIEFETGEDPDHQIATEIPYDYYLLEITPRRNYSFRNKKWYFNIPRVDRARMIGDYMKVRFTWNDPLHRYRKAEFRNLTTSYRKAY
jgi:hypothetical protein